MKSTKQKKSPKRYEKFKGNSKDKNRIHELSIDSLKDKSKHEKSFSMLSNKSFLNTPISKSRVSPFKHGILSHSQS